ncbi:MAG TPA: membrane protein insertion efficiency factor YidD [Thermoanaerobaculia bacterium]|nr:membrane protein insertion efficiency factor YidD [Thermoanaerobaculia bacterium]
MRRRRRLERSGEPGDRARQGPPSVDAGRAARRLAWRPLAVTLALLGLVLGADWSRPPERQLSTRTVLAAIDLYQATLARGVSRVGVRCRFTPSCSRYGEAVIARDGIALGGARALWRVMRCGPWTPYGTLDPPEPSEAVPPAPAEENARRVAETFGGDSALALDQ